MTAYESALTANNPTGSLFIHESTDPNAETDFNALARIGKLNGAYSLPSALVLGMVSHTHHVTVDQDTTVDLDLPILRNTRMEAVLIKADVTGDATIDVLVDGTTIVNAGAPVAIVDDAGVWQLIALDAALVDINGPDTPGTYDKTLTIELVTDTGASLANCTVHTLYRLM